MAPDLFKGLLVWYRRWAAIYLRACLHGVIPLCKSLKSGHLGRPVLKLDGCCLKVGRNLYASR